MAKKTISYADAQAELERILQKLQTNEYPIDELKPALQRSNELIALCRTKLTEVNKEIDTILKEMS